MLLYFIATTWIPPLGFHLLDSTSWIPIVLSPPRTLHDPSPFLNSSTFELPCQQCSVTTQSNSKIRLPQQLATVYPQNAAQFSATVVVNSLSFASEAFFSSKKEAENSAAGMAFNYFGPQSQSQLQPIDHNFNSFSFPEPVTRDVPQYYNVPIVEENQTWLFRIEKVQLEMKNTLLEKKLQDMNIVDMEVQKWKNLKKDWGHEVYEVVITLSESKRWNPSGSYEVEKHIGRSVEEGGRYHLKHKRDFI